MRQAIEQATIAIRVAGAAILAACAGGCASFDGQAKPVLPVADIKAVGTSYPPGLALKTFYGKNDATQQKAYRDEVIGAYLAAADLRYLEFRAQLSREMKGSNVLLGVGLLGLTGGASLAGQSTANALSAGAAGLAGSRATISKELWFEKTLPALFAAMDARRTTVRRTIMVRMREPSASYGLAEAFADLFRYQEAASLEVGVQAISASAAQEASAAQALYDKEVAFYSAAPEVGVADLRGSIKRALGAKIADAAAINRAAAAVGVDAQATPTATAEAILKLALTKVTVAEVSGILDKVQQALKDPAP